MVTPWRGLGSAWAQDRHQTASGCPDALNAPTPHGLAQPRCIVYTVTILCFQLELRICCCSIEFPPSHSFLLSSLVKAVIFVLVNGWMDCVSRKGPLPHCSLRKKVCESLPGVEWRFGAQETGILFSV